MRLRAIICFAVVLCICRHVPGGDWPMWGGAPGRNMVSDEKNLPAGFEPGKVRDDGNVDMASTRGVRWVARLGGQSYGNVTVARGRVLIGTNNDAPYDPRHAGDRGVVLCLDEATGRLIWQLVVPKLPAGRNVDYDGVGICSSPTVDGDRVYVITNRCEVLCLDLAGMANGNDGPFVDEARYMAPAGSAPVAPGPTDADIIWRYDMRDELGVNPHQASAGSVLVYGERVYANTSNGRNWTERHIPAPDAPALICLDKRTGRLLGLERSGISRRMFLCNWSSPSAGVINGRSQVVFGADDGFCYGFDPEPQAGADGVGVLRELWRFDCNPAHRRVRDGKPVKYDNPRGPSGILATPVMHAGRVYVAVGRNPEGGDGDGCMSCIDPSGGSGDISATGRAWMNENIGRSLTTAAVADGLVYIADLAGYVYCLDAATGAELWKHDTKSRIWGSPLVADGKVLIGDEEGVLTILAAGRALKVIAAPKFEGPILSTAVAANGTLYVATDRHLYAIGGK